MTESVPFTTKEKVQVLLAEYSTIRAEILQRNSVLNQILTVGGVVTIAILSFSFSKYNSLTIGIGLTLILFLLCLIFYARRAIEFDTLAAAKRIREIECAINEIAAERLLVWETNNGLYKVRNRMRFKYFLERLVRWQGPT